MTDLQDLFASLRRSPAILDAFVRTIPEDRLDIRRGDGFWTIAEHVSHLAQVQPMLLQRMERFLVEEAPVFVPYLPGAGEDEPATPPRMEMAAALDRFADYRDRQLRLLEAAGEAVWRKAATHPEYEAYSLYILTRHALMHDHWHMYRMEELWLARNAFLTRLD